MDPVVVASVLRNQRDIAQWQVSQVRTVRHERYLTFLAVESEREARATRTTVWLALPAADGRQGEASFTLGAGDGAEDLRHRLGEALVTARAAQAPAWNLPEPDGDGVARTDTLAGLATSDVDGGGAVTAKLATAGGLVDLSIANDGGAALARLADAVGEACRAAPWVRPSTLELFATVHDRRLINHQGLDLREQRTTCYAEFVLLHRPDGGGDEVEVYDRTEAAALADLRLPERIREAADGVRALAGAGAPPTGTMPVLITDGDAASLLGWYASHADAALHARGVNGLALGKPVVKRLGGDPLAIAVDARVPSLAAYRFDEHGYAAAHQPLVVDDVLTGLHGSGRWMQVLHRPPRGQRGTLLVPPGPTPLADLRQGCLEVVRFSEFHPRQDSGAFSGEIRLAWWHRPDGSRVAVRGGSVSGTLATALAACRTSREVATIGTYHGPRGLRIDATVTA